MNRRRVREVIGLGASVLLALGAGVMLQEIQLSPNARVLAIAIIMLFLGLTIGLVNWMAAR